MKRKRTASLFDPCVGEARKMERSRFKNKFKNPMDSLDLEDLWLDGYFCNRLGDNVQSIRKPHTGSKYYDYTESLAIRKLLNAKSKKPRNKKYYKKTRNANANANHNQQLPLKKELETKDWISPHMEEVYNRGGFYATCKACELPMTLSHMHNYDMSICWDCENEMTKELENKWLKKEHVSTTH